MEVEPVIRYSTHLADLDEEEDDKFIVHNGGIQNGGVPYQNGGEPIQNGLHHHVHVEENGVIEVENKDEEVDEEPPVNIISGPDWESVNYSVTKVINMQDSSYLG